MDIGVVAGWMARRHDGLAATAAGGWIRRGSGERDGDMPGPMGIAAARDFDPSSDLPLCNFGPSPFLLSSQEGPFLL